MKKLNIKVLSLFVAMAGMFASCSQEPLVKADFDNAVAVDSTDLPVIVALDCEAVGAFDAIVNVTIKGGYDNILEFGIVFADNEEFSNAGVSVVYAEDLAAQIPDSIVVDKEVGYTFQIPVSGMSQNTNYYISAYAYVRNNPTVEYAGELLQITTAKVYDHYCNGVYSSNLFGAWEQTMEVHKTEANIYRLPDYIAPGYDLNFYWDSETGEVALLNNTWATGYVHPSYGMINGNNVGGVEYDAETKTFTFYVSYTVAAGSFGNFSDTFTIIE